MRKLLILIVLPGCALFQGDFFAKRAPAGHHCSDMPIYPSGASIPRPIHRLRAVASPHTATTELARLEALRRAACAAGADAVIDAVSNDSARAPDGRFYTQVEGVSVLYTTPTQSTTEDVGAPVGRPKIPTSPAPNAGLNLGDLSSK